MKMNYSRAVAIIKSECPRQWARMHAQTIATTRERYGMSGVLLQTQMMVEALGDWTDTYGAATFLREWAAKHRKEIDHVAQAGRSDHDNPAADGRSKGVSQKARHRA